MPLADIAQKGFSKAEAYNTYRPGYHDDAVDRLLQVLEIQDKKGAKVLEVGAGTGLFTETLADRVEKYEITAVEPHDEMRKELEQRKLPLVTLVKGTGESMEDIQDTSFDAVVIAQAFHWMANMNALRELSRVLKPRGVLGMIWNIEDYNAPRDWACKEKWADALKQVLWSLDDGHKRFRDMQWKQVFDEQGRSDPISIHTSEPLFSLPLGEDTVGFENWLSKDLIWKRYQTLSQIANLEPAELADVEKTFWKAIDEPNTRTDEQGRVAVHGQTYLAWTTKIPDEPIEQ